ncbi:hypothetical protein DFH09DRAFT_1089686 [Mycena vulgaris]|nr:hypothetical protein DFH09DRAFT_1089686 [Mycena vulgaris]
MASVGPTPIKCHEASAMALARSVIVFRLVQFRKQHSMDLLADKPIEGADAIRSLADWSEDVVGRVQGHRKAAGKKIWDGEVEKLVFQAIWEKMNYKQDPIPETSDEVVLVQNAIAVPKLAELWVQSV